MSSGTGRPSEEQAVEADDGWAAAEGGEPPRTPRNAPGNADAVAPGLVEEAAPRAD